MEKNNGNGKRDVHVRSLTGESVSVSIEPNNTIQQLKQLLKHVFPPASTSPNFHLFLKGTKLSLQKQISSFSLGSEEFLVLVPFARKERQNSEKIDDSGGSSTSPNSSLPSKVAQSTYSDLVQDLSTLSSFSCYQHQSEVELENGGEQSQRTSEDYYSPVKRRRRSTVTDDKNQDLVVDLLQSSHTDTLDDNGWKIFLQILDSVNCLADQKTSNCILRIANSPDNVAYPCTSKNSLCMCPPWLKKVMKAFAFLNTYTAFCQLCLMKVTLSMLRKALDQLSKFGLEVGIADIEQLAILCPKIVKLVEDEAEVPVLGDTLTILNGSCLEKKDQHGPTCNVVSSTARKRDHLFKILNEMKKRGDAFVDVLSAAVKKLQRGNDRGELFSLEDLRGFVNDATGTREKRDGKRSRRNNHQSSNSNSFEQQCNDTNPLLPEEMVEHLKHGLGSYGQIVHVEEIQARHGNCVEIPSELSESTTSALKRIGITRLYSHQAQAIQASLAGKHVVVATMTSSGKSLCYNVPVLEVLSRNLLACALYLFPTKALAQDQLRTLLIMTNGFEESLKIGIYDGDTPQVDRLWLRDNARVLITNPDMLHVSVLPSHGQFSRFLSNLRFVILDEAHAYKGAFGSHAALIIRRLRRICSHVYGSDPLFVFSTATSANPGDHAMELANLKEIELIDEDGSPSALKLFMLWNPPLCDWRQMMGDKKSKSSSSRDVGTKRSSPIMEISLLFAEMVQHRLRCIAFCKSRKLCELVLFYTREILQDAAPHLVDSICGYRGGYTAEDRRRIESDFFSGCVCGIAATNALELGIDVGHIDVTLHLGFPGSIASLWQQAGRSGRRGKPSLAVYVAFDGPLDQYFMKFPNKLFRSPIECCHIDAKNKQVLEQQLMCAAAEHPLSLIFDENSFGPGLESAIFALRNKGLLATDPSRESSARIWNYIGHEKAPSRNVSIRAIETEKYRVIDVQKNEVLEEIEESRAFFQVYDGAVYMNQGKTYLVKDLDLSSKIAWCQQADLKYYTKTRDYTDIHVIGGQTAYVAKIISSTFPRTSAQVSACKVTTTWFGFRRIWRGSNQVFDTVELSLPDYSYESQAVWIRVPESVKLAVETLNYSFRGGLHAACHALLNVIPLYIICNPSDLASECVNPHDARYAPERILLYDPRPGGTGISAQVQPLFTELLTAALELLTSCVCLGDAGCPKCVQSLTCGEYNEVLHKNAAIMIIKAVIESEKSGAGEVPG
ncbi:OLC1v1013955C1 [Oldenlandia corymbosa var. corymbosa]|uniref:OLC1v1013955C1 n=1 Tax=Oldenlandia corymbosa var. corymbosa TaxID=529605 RepID=A0AAV1DZN6_OLDCO|nr:OLC1v1013955C1 [Oldenlandia corymbosa var. corymbosa]